jgi:CheY-like chemotaxis protein
MAPEKRQLPFLHLHPTDQCGKGQAPVARAFCSLRWARFVYNLLPGADDRRVIGTMMAKPTVLILDDDPIHLKIYGWIVDRGDFRAVTALAKNGSADLPAGEHVDVVVLDYRLGGSLTAKDLLPSIRHTFPAAHIVILSELEWMPADLKGEATGFVRKGEPEELLNVLRDLTHQSDAV